MSLNRIDRRLRKRPPAGPSPPRRRYPPRSHPSRRRRNGRGRGCVAEGTKQVIRAASWRCRPKRTLPAASACASCASIRSGEGRPGCSRGSALGRRRTCGKSVLSTSWRSCSASDRRRRPSGPCERRPAKARKVRTTRDRRAGGGSEPPGDRRGPAPRGRGLLGGLALARGRRPAPACRCSPPLLGEGQDFGDDASETALARRPSDGSRIRERMTPRSAGISSKRTKRGPLKVRLRAGGRRCDGEGLRLSARARRKRVPPLAGTSAY